MPREAAEEMAMEATSRSCTACAGWQDGRSRVVRRTFPGLAYGKSAVDPALRR